MAERHYESLFKVIGNDVSMDGYCVTDAKPNYIDWERNVATPALEQLGYTVWRWEVGEYDSFGPLSRVCVVKRDDTVRWLVYG